MSFLRRLLLGCFTQVTASPQKACQLRPPHPYLELLPRYVSKRQTRSGAEADSYATNVVGQPVFTTDRFPADLDTTSIGLTVTQPDDHVVQSVLDEMLKNLTGDGITMVNSCHQYIISPRIVC
jgi:hypothetical protein